MAFVNGIDTHVQRSDGATPLLVALCDSDGNPINSYSGALDIHDADVHRFIVNEFFHQHTGVITTFAVGVAAGATQITLTDPTGFAVGDTLHLSNGTVEIVHPIITILVGNLATLDRPLDNSFSAGDSIEKSITNMVVVGSLSSPQSFKITPYNGDVLHITRILLSMIHDTASDQGTFGDIDPLINGVVLRKYDGATASFQTLTNWKYNADIASDVYDVDYLPLSKKGKYGTKARGTFANAGAILYLDGAAGDYAEILIQDDLTSTATGIMRQFKIKAQGHKEGA